jgi:hypothetical protein
LLLAAMLAPLASAAESADHGLNVQFSEELTQEDNLYRLPAGIDPAETLLGRDARRDDLISSTSAALAGRCRVKTSATSASLRLPCSDRRAAIR